MSSVLRTLYGYQAWANSDLFQALKNLDPEKHKADLQTALRLIGHNYAVSRIFTGHLLGIQHGFLSDTLDETPALNDLVSAVQTSDQWYIDYVQTLSAPALAESIAFIFTDGDRGYMTREEMLVHVAVHAGYHRGEVGRILRQLSIIPPWDTFAVYLHKTDPARRQSSQV